MAYAPTPLLHQPLRVNLEDLVAATPEDGLLLSSPRSKLVCKRHGILMQELYPRTVQSFFESRSDLPEIVQRRYDHFCTRRAEKLNFLIEERLRLIEADAASPAQPQPQAVHHTPLPMSVPHGGRQQPLNQSFEADPQLELKVRREEERLQKNAVAQQMQDEERLRKEARLAWADERHQHTLATLEERKAQEALLEAERKMSRREHAIEAQRLHELESQRKKELLLGREEERLRAAEERRQQEEDDRRMKREKQEQRAADIRRKRDDLERARATHLESKIIDKHERGSGRNTPRAGGMVCFEIVAPRCALPCLQARTRQEERTLREQDRQAQLEMQRAATDHHKEALLVQKSEERAELEQARAEAKARKAEEVQRRARDLEEMRRLQALAKVQEKEARQQQALEAARQQQLWEANEKRLRALDAQEAVERQRRKESYEKDLKQQQLQTKMQRIMDVEELKWRAANEKRELLESVRLHGSPSTPRMGAMQSPRTGTRRSNSLSTGTTRHAR